ncbi:MAG TPA: hypothetical protein VFS67_34315 [Polyangiaceae bacterium]|jgi:hypothetical protein|nr:hypothetical protein [Polyangiaceae bacterium]
MNQNSNPNIDEAIELSEAELGSIQGGNLLADARSTFESAVGDIVQRAPNAAVHSIGALAALGETLSWASRHRRDLPKRPKPHPDPPYLEQQPYL